MTGATAAHDEITGNLYSSLKSRLVPRGCRVYQQNRKVAAGVDFFYPDVVVQCGPRELTSLLATDPVLIAEVLWFRSDGYGVVRFDGESFTRFTKRTGCAVILSSISSRTGRGASGSPASRRFSRCRPATAG